MMTRDDFLDLHCWIYEQFAMVSGEIGEARAFTYRIIADISSQKTLPVHFFRPRTELADVYVNAKKKFGMKKSELKSISKYGNGFFGVETVEHARIIRDLGFLTVPTRYILEKYYEVKKNNTVETLLRDLYHELNFNECDEIRHYESFVYHIVSAYDKNNLPPKYAFNALKKIGKIRKLLKDQFGWSDKSIKTIGKGFISVSEDHVMYIKLLQMPVIDCHKLIERFDNLMSK